MPKNRMLDWIEVARRTLVDEGIAGLKVGRLANRLGVSRGGFYHIFKDRDELLDHVIKHWSETCRFLPEETPPARPDDAIEWLERAIARLIASEGYDNHFDLAVREWARTDKRAEWAIERADRRRLDVMQKFFEAVGCDAEHAAIRARVFYYHQIGYHAIGVRQSNSERNKNARTYIEILCGTKAMTRDRTVVRRLEQAESFPLAIEPVA